MQTLKQENIKLKKDNNILKQQIQEMHKQLQDRTLNFWKRNQQPVSKRYVNFHRTYSNIKTTKNLQSHLQNQLQCKSQTIIQLTNTIQSLRQELLHYKDQQKRKQFSRKEEIKLLQNMNTDLVSHKECQEKFNEFIMVLQGKNNEISKLTKIIKDMEGNGKQKMQFIKNKGDQEGRKWKGVKGKEKKKDELSQLREENESLQNIIRKITEQINKVSIKNKMLQTSIINLEIDLQKQRQKNATIDFKSKEKRIQDLGNQEIVILTQKLMELENKNNQLEQKIYEMTKKMKNTQQVNTKQNEKQMQQMRKRVKRQQQEIKQKNETIVNMLKNMDEFQKKFQKNEREYEIQNDENKKHKYEQHLQKLRTGKVQQEERKVNEQKIQQERIKQEKENKIIIQQCKNEESKKIIKLFEEQITMQKRKFDQIKNKYDQIRKENQELKKTKEIEKQKNQVKREEKNNQNLKIKLLEISVKQKLIEIQKLEKYQTQTNFKQMTINQKQQLQESTKKINQKLKKTIEKLEGQLKSKSQKISEMLTQMDQSQKNTKAASQRSSNQQVEEIKMKMNSEIIESRRVIEQLITYLEDKNLTLQKRIEDKGKVEQELRNQVNSLESQIEIMNKEMEKLKRESIPINQHKEKIKLLQGQLKDKQQSMLQISEAINAADTKNSQQRQQMIKRISELEGKLLNFKQLPQSNISIGRKDQQNQTEKLKKRIDKLEGQLKTKSQTISQMLKQMDQSQKNTKAASQRASNQQVEEIKMKMDSEIIESRRVIKQLKQSITYLEDKNLTLQKRIEDKGKVEQEFRNQVNSLESYIKMMNKEMEKLKRESIPINQHKEKIKLLQGQLKDKQQSMLQISEAINAADTKNSQQRQQMIKRISELEEKLLNFKQLPHSNQPIRKKESLNQIDKLKKWIDKLQGQLRSKSQTIQQLLKQSYVKNINLYQSPTNIVISQQSQVIDMRQKIQSLQLELQKQRQINKSLLNQISSIRQFKNIEKQLTKPQLIQKSKSQLQNQIEQLIKQNQFYKIHSNFSFNPNIQIKQLTSLQSQVYEHQFFKKRNDLKLLATPFQEQSNLYQSILINMQQIQPPTLDTFQQFLLSNPQIKQKIKKVYKNTEQLTLIKLCQIVFDLHRNNQNLIEQRQSLKAQELEIEIKNLEDEYFRTQVTKQREQLKNQIAFLSKTLQTKNCQLNTILTLLKDTQKKAEKALIKEKEYFGYKSLYQNLLNQNLQFQYKLQNKNIDQQKKTNYQRIIEQLQIENQHLNQIVRENKHGCKANSPQLEQVLYQLKSIKNQQSRLKQNSQKSLSKFRAQINQHYQQLWQEKRKFTQNILEYNLLIDNIVDLVKCDNKQSILEVLKQKITHIQQMEQKIDSEQITLKQLEQEVYKKNQEINKSKNLLDQTNQRLGQLEQQYKKEQYQSMLQKQKEKFVELQQCNKQMMKQIQLNKKIFSEKDQMIKEKVEQFKSKESLFIAKEHQNQILKKQLQNMKQIIKQINQNKKKMNQQLQDIQSELCLKNMELQTYKLKIDKSPYKWIQNQEELEKLKNQLELQKQTIQTLKNQYQNERKSYQLLEAKTKEIRKVINEELLKEISEDLMLPNQSIEQKLCFKELQDLKRIKLYIQHKNEGIKRLKSSKQDQINIKYFNKQFETKKMEYQKIINGLKQRIISLEFSIKILSIKEIDEKDLKQFIKKIQLYQDQNKKQMFKQTIINFIKKQVEKQNSLTKKLDKIKTELVQKQIEICQIQGQIKTLKNDSDVKKMELQKKDESIQILTKQVKQYEQSLHQLIQILKQKSDLLNDLQKKFKQLNIQDKEYQFQKKIDQLQKKSGQIIFRQQSLRQSNNEQRSRMQKSYSFYSIQKDINYYQQLIEKLKEVLNKINRQNYSDEIEEISNLLYLKKDKQKLQTGWDETREFKNGQKQLLLKKQFDKITQQDKQNQFDNSFQKQILRNELQQKQKIIRIMCSQIENYRQELQSQRKHKQQQIFQLNLKIKQMQKELKKKIQLKKNTSDQGYLKYQAISEIYQERKFQNRRKKKIKTYHKEQKNQQQQNSFEETNSKVSYLTAEPDIISIIKRKSKKEYKQAQKRRVQLLKKEISRLNLKVSKIQQLQKQNELFRFQKNKLQQEIKEFKPEYKIILEKLHQSEYRTIVEDIVIQLKKNQVIPKKFILQDQLIKETQILKRKLQVQQKKNKLLQLDFERNQKLKIITTQIKQVNQQNYDQIISELKMQLEQMTEKLNKKDFELKGINLQKDKLKLLIEQMQNNRDLKQQKIADLQKYIKQLKTKQTKPILLHHGRK